MDNNIMQDLLKPVSPEEALKKYAVNLTDLARLGKVDPVILLDEIEKAHPQVFHLFLQIFDGKIKPGDVVTPKLHNGEVLLTTNPKQKTT